MAIVCMVLRLGQHGVSAIPSCRALGVGCGGSCDAGRGVGQELQPSWCAACKDRVTMISVLDREMFSEAEAARLLRSLRAHSTTGLTAAHSVARPTLR